MKYREERELVCEIGRRCWLKGWGASNDGNFSLKLDNDLFLITPANVSKGFMTVDMPVVVNSSGQIVDADARYAPSSESILHLAIYAMRDDVGAVFHAHPPLATAFAVANIALDGFYIPETAYYLGSVPVVPYAEPGSHDLAEAVRPYLENHDALMLGNHGTLSVGGDLLSAYNKMETLEYLAQLSFNLKIIGSSKRLNKEQADCVLEKRAKEKPPGRHPGFVDFGKE